jgi:hypothetical protein
MKLERRDIESILSCVMDKLGYPHQYEKEDPETLVISYTELEEILESFLITQEKRK